MADIVGEQLKSYVAKQIQDRQTAHGSGINSERSPEVLSYLNSKTAWVKLASAVEISGDRVEKEGFRPGFSGQTLAQNYILFGGVAKKSGGVLVQRDGIIDKNIGAYNVTARNPSELEFGLVPMPGIESVEVKNKERGSIREATVKLKAYNKEQFDIIDILYLRLGYTVLLEWGNSLYINGNNLEKMGYTLIEDNSGNGFFQNRGTHTSYLKIIEGYRKGKKGNYDGLLGKVKNFNWSFNQDGSYDIELSIISAGDVVESLKSNITPPKVILDYLNTKFPPEAKTKSDEEEEEENPDITRGAIESSAKDNVISAFMLLNKIALKESGVDYIESPSDISYTLGGNTEPIGVFVKSAEVTALGGLSSLLEEFSPTGFLITDLLQLSNLSPTEENPVGNLSSNVKDKDICYLNYNNGEDYEIFDPGFYWRFGSLLEFLQNQCVYKNVPSNTPLFDIDFNMWRNKMLYYPSQISFDPRVCVVNSTLGEDKIFPQLIPWAKEDEGYAWTMNVYISFVKIQDAIDSSKDEEGNVSLFDFLSNICSALNESLGGINNLEPVFDEEENILRILDSSYSVDPKPPSYMLEMYGYKGSTSNFVRNLDLKTAITPEFATMVTVGATADGYVKGTEATMFSKWNKGLVDRFKEKFRPANQSTADNTNEARDNYIDAFIAPRESLELALGYKMADIGGGDIGDSSPQLMDDVIESNKAIATEFYKYLNAEAQKLNPEFASSILGFIPFSLGVTIDGLSGIKIYNELHADTRFLPKNYPDNLRFVITGVRHKLSNQDWETTLDTVVIPNTLTKGNSYALLKSLMAGTIAAGAVLRAANIVASAATNIITSTASTSNPSISAPSTSQTGTAARPVGGRGYKTYGTIGKNGNRNDLSPQSLSLQSIDNLANTSGAQNGGPYASIIRKRIVEVAASYVGNNEIRNPPRNPGWWDPDYEAKFRQLKSYPWTKTQPWCVWFTQLCWKEAYTVGNKLVPNVNSLEYANFYKNIWSSTLKNGATIGAGSAAIVTNFKRIKKFISLKNAINGTYIPEPGDIAVYSYGHVDIVIKPFIERGKLAGYSAIGGNTDSQSRNDGGATKYYPNKNDWKKAVGFCKVITPFNKDKQYS